MRYSPEALTAFVETVAAGSFLLPRVGCVKASPLSVPPLPILKPIWV
jgi:hypothetical protein